MKKLDWKWLITLAALALALLKPARTCPCMTEVREPENAAFVTVSPGTVKIAEPQGPQVVLLD